MKDYTAGAHPSSGALISPSNVSPLLSHTPYLSPVFSLSLSLSHSQGHSFSSARLASLAGEACG